MPEIDDVRIGETIAVEWGNAIRDRTIQRYANAAERDELHPNPTEGDLSYLEDTNSIEVYDGFSWVSGIADGAVTTAKIANNAVTQPKLAPEAVTFSRIADGAVITSKLADGAVTPGKIASNAVTQEKLAPEAVTFSRIAGNAIAAFERSGATVETDVDVPSSVGNLATVTLNIPSSWSSWNCVAFAQTTALPLINFADVRLRVRIDGTDGPEFANHVPSGAGGAQAAVAASFRSGITTTGNRTIALRGYLGVDTQPARLKTVFLYARAF